MEQARAKNPVLTAVAVLAGCGICCLGIGGYLLRGCMTEHSRSHGLNDVSFRIAPSGEWMVFSGGGNGGRDLYRFDFDYRRVTQLTNSGDYESAPVVSPDGNQIAFARGVDGDRADHICILDLKTGKIKQLTSGDQNDTSPDFSPDGKELIFTRETQYRWGGLASSWNEGGTIWVMNADGTAQAPLPGFSSPAWSPRWSPDGNFIAWSDLEGCWLKKLHSDRPARRIASNGHYPAFSPDSSEIAFNAGQYSPDQHIVKYSLSEGKSTTIAQTEGGCSCPQYRPHSNEVYFRVEAWKHGPTGSPTFSLWSVKSDGADEQQVASDVLFESPMAYRP